MIYTVPYCLYELKPLQTNDYIKALSPNIMNDIAPGVARIITGEIAESEIRDFSFKGTKQK